MRRQQVPFTAASRNPEPRPFRAVSAGGSTLKRSALNSRANRSSPPDPPRLIQPRPGRPCPLDRTGPLRPGRPDLAIRSRGPIPRPDPARPDPARPSDLPVEPARSSPPAWPIRPACSSRPIRAGRAGDPPGWPTRRPGDPRRPVSTRSVAAARVAAARHVGRGLGRSVARHGAGGVVGPCRPCRAAFRGWRPWRGRAGGWCSVRWSGGPVAWRVSGVPGWFGGSSILTEVR